MFNHFLRAHPLVSKQFDKIKSSVRFISGQSWLPVDVRHAAQDCRTANWKTIQCPFETQ